MALSVRKTAADRFSVISDGVWADPEIQKQTAEAENAQNKTAEKSTQEDYNKATNSYSGKYGQEKDLDEVTKDQIDKILHEKAEHIHQLFENGGVE